MAKIAVLLKMSVRGVHKNDKILLIRTKVIPHNVALTGGESTQTEYGNVKPCPGPISLCLICHEHMFCCINNVHILGGFIGVFFRS